MDREEAPVGVNDVDTLIAIAPDSPVERSVVPPRNDAKPAIAAEHDRLLAERPYELTSEDVIFTVYVDKQGIEPGDRPAVRGAHVATPRACLRTSPPPNTFGWGVAADAEGRLTLVPVESERYRELVDDPDVRVVRAMRSSRWGVGEDGP